MAPLLLHADRLFDGERAQTDAAILIDGGLVRWAGPRARVPASAKGAREERVPDGATLLPGLINCHIHLTLSGVPDIAADAKASDSVLALRALVNAVRGLEAGVTTVRDLGAPSYASIELGRAIARGDFVGPNVVAAGRGITSTGGHGLEIGREADGADEVRRAVREQLHAGASVIKLFSTGGILGGGASPDISQLTLEETRAAVEEGHSRGLRVTTHALAAKGMRTAIEAGVDSIGHAALLDAETIRLCKEKNVAIVPTLAAIRAILAHPTELGEAVMDRARVVSSRHQESIRGAHKAGVTIAAGTDAGTPFNYAEHFSVELGALVEIGMTPEEALRAATSVAAGVIGRSDVGRIVEGTRADFVAVPGDPLRDIGAMRSVLGVWKDGQRLAGSSVRPRRA